MQKQKKMHTFEFKTLKKEKLTKLIKNQNNKLKNLKILCEINREIIVITYFEEQCLIFEKQCLTFQLFISKKKQKL